MTHDEIKKLLPAYCGGEITQAERAWVEEHLSSCRSCRTDVADLKTALRLIRNSPEVETPPWMTSRIMSGILDQTEPSPGLLHRLFFPLQIKLPILAMAILLLGVAGYYVTLDNSINPKPGVPQPQQSAPFTSQAEPQTSANTPPAVTASDAAKLPPSDRKDLDQTKSKVSPAQESTNRDTFASASDTHNKDLPSAPKMNKGAKRAKKPAAESEAIAPLGNSAEIQANDRPAAATIRLQAKNASAAEDAIRQAVYNSGGMITGEATNGGRQLKARIPAVNSRELLDQLQHLGRIIERPAITESTENVDMDISW